MKHFFGRLSLIVTVCLTATLVCGAQSLGSSAPSQSDTSKPAQKSEGQDKAKDTKNDEKNKDSATAKKKPKKVWTNEEISTVGGTISVVGDSGSPGSASGSSTRGTNADSPQDKQIEQYKDQLRQLQAQLDSTDKKINDLRNFKADNSSPSGGIDPRHGYSMTPVPDQIKQLEEKKKQIQAKIDAVEDEARKKGIEPGQLR